MLNATATIADGMETEAVGRMLAAVHFIVKTRDLLMIDGMIGTGGVGYIANFAGKFTAGLTLSIILIVHCSSTDGDYLYT